MTGPRQPDRHRRPLLWLPVLVVLMVVAPLCLCWSWFNQTPEWLWALSRDSREYPHVDDPMHVTHGDGDLEEDLLPYFRVNLPCDVEHLRYGEFENYGNNLDLLHLRFDTSPSCLGRFLQDNGLSPAVRFQPVVIPPEYEWHINSGNASYEGAPSPHVRLLVSIDRSAARPIVFLVSENDGLDTSSLKVGSVAFLG